MATHRMYSQIVNDENDIVGLIAYALYKQHKIEFFKEVRKANGGSEPTEDEIQAFIRSSSTSSQIKKYRAEANGILSDVVISVAQEQINQAESEMLHDYEEKISQSVKKETPGKWKTIWLNVAGTALFSVILTLIFIIGNFSERSTRQIADQMVEGLNKVLKTEMSVPSDTIPK